MTMDNLEDLFLWRTWGLESKIRKEADGEIMTEMIKRILGTIFIMLIH